jgi:FtsP/CotA-like multicopper oxidase with cupredoxin domain
MRHEFSRRGFLAGSAALAASTALPPLARAEAAPLALSATSRVLDVDGRAATEFGLRNGAGGSGLILDPGQRFALTLRNDLDVATIIHWHGQIPPNVQDGVPDSPAPLLQPGEQRAYDFAPSPGTHWMHSHVPVQEMQLLAAPLIVRRAEDLAADRQEVVMLLHDFSFRAPEEVLAEITGGAGHDAAPGAAGAMPGMDHGGMAMGGDTAMGGMAMGGMAMDLNDYDFDAYLANDRTLNDPEVVAVEPGGRVLLRVINAAAATVFWIDSGAAVARLVAVDGQPVQPLPGSRFGLAMGQRLDIELDLPGAGAFPVLALREGARERTGIVLATPGAQVPKLAPLADQAAPAFDTDLAQEAGLRALVPLPRRAADAVAVLMLGGSMQPYVWTINGRGWPDHLPLTAPTGARVEMQFHNMSMMAHPMHLHGHHFQVVGIGMQRFSGALRDTVHVPPMSMLTVALDAGEAARWMLHCHHMPHLSTGMMTEFVVTA